MERDYRFGIKNEEIIKEILGHNWKKTDDKYHPYDFHNGDDNYVELKTRRCRHDTYPTTMIGFNKIKYAKQNPNKNFRLLFKYTDGLYYYDIDQDKEYQHQTGGRCDRGRPEFSQYCYIPIEELTKF